MARQEIEGSNHLIKKFSSSLLNADLSNVDILKELILLPCFLHRFWKSYVRHSATKAIAKIPLSSSKIAQSTTIHYANSSFPENYVSTTEVPSDLIHKFIYNAEPNSSLEASTEQHIDTTMHSQPTDTSPNETRNRF